MLRLHSSPHAQSQHHSNAQHGGEREERGGQGEAQVRPKNTPKQISNNYGQNCLEVITGRHCW